MLTIVMIMVMVMMIGIDKNDMLRMRRMLVLNGGNNDRISVVIMMIMTIALIMLKYTDKYKP